MELNSWICCTVVYAKTFASKVIRINETPVLLKFYVAKHLFIYALLVPAPEKRRKKKNLCGFDPDWICVGMDVFILC